MTAVVTYNVTGPDLSWPRQARRRRTQLQLEIRGPWRPHRHGHVSESPPFKFQPVGVRVATRPGPDVSVSESPESPQPGPGRAPAWAQRRRPGTPGRLPGRGRRPCSVGRARSWFTPARARPRSPDPAPAADLAAAGPVTVTVAAPAGGPGRRGGRRPQASGCRSPAHCRPPAAAAVLNAAAQDGFRAAAARGPHRARLPGLVTRTRHGDPQARRPGRRLTRTRTPSAPDRTPRLRPGGPGPGSRAVPVTVTSHRHRHRAVTRDCGTGPGAGRQRPGPA